MCGIFGMVGSHDVSKRIQLGLFELQHRGEQGSGIAVFNGTELRKHKGEGLVTEVFKDVNVCPRGYAGIGHDLYSTVGKSGAEKQPKTFQPLKGVFHGVPFALAHNGNLINLEGLRREAEEGGYKFHSRESDTEVIVGLLSVAPEGNFVEALKGILPRLEGAFALAVLYGDKVIGARDKFGIRPLCFGVGIESSLFAIASEECAFHTAGCRFVREIEPGEIIVLSKDGIEEKVIWATDARLRFCIFEFIYFARPDSRFCDRMVVEYREAAGRFLAQEHPVVADIVSAVPESGKIYHSALAQELGLPLRNSIFKNRYFSKRTFLTSRDTDRRSLQEMKFYIPKRVVHEKRIIITEDSIVRANAAPEIVRMLRESGAREVHLRVGSSPVRYPCHLGIDMSTRGELKAAHLSVEEIGRKIIQVDSLGYLSLEGMIKATGFPKENLCLGCFNGEYPVPPSV